MLNNAVIMGRLTNAPELRATPNGNKVISFTVAVTRNYKEDQADFIDCVAWKGTAEFISKYFRKGSMIAVVGSIQTRNFEDSNGNKRKAVEILVDEANFCGSKAENESTAPTGVIQTTPNKLDVNVADFEEISSDDDLPF